MTLKPKDVEKIKQAAQQLFKSKQFTAYDSDLQAVVCTIQALQDYLQQHNQPLNISLLEPLIYEPLDNY
jgi:hypothetical protein